jgi:hypothetical protein
MLYYLHVSQIPTTGGGIGLVHGNTSGPWPSSAKTSGGTDHPTCRSPKRPGQPRILFANGWSIRHWRDLSCGLVSIASRFLRSFKSSMVDSITSMTRSPLAINTHLAVEEIRVRGCSLRHQCQCAPLSRNSKSMSAWMDVGSALQWRTTRIWRASSLIWMM